jgi:ribonuclease J
MRKKTTKIKPLQIIPLGGVGEIGKNMTAIRYGEKILVIDAGLMFPDEEMFGVDIVIPDVSFLVENQENVVGIILTHGHEDHIGALPYVLPQINVPIWGTRLTLGFVRAKLEEHEGLLESTVMNEIAAGDTIDLDDFQVESFSVSHSIPDAVGFAIKTPAGMIVHTSDFKFDYTPVGGNPIDVSRLARLGDEDVLALLTDTTNVEKAGYTPSERLVGKTFEDAFGQAEGRIVVAMFASNVHRMQQVFNTAQKYGRKVVVVGRSMARNSQIASELGYLHVPEDIEIPIGELNNTPPEKVVIMSTGSQGEPLAALSRMAMGEHKKIKVGPGDTVIMAASPIPGNEDLILRTINHLYRRGAKVIHEVKDQVHVSGHGNQEDLKLMLYLVRPKYIVPVHGEYRHLAKYSEIAAQMGYGPEWVFQLDIGDILEFQNGEAHEAGKIENVGMVMVDGIGVGDVTDVVLRDRRHLAQDGVIIAVLTIEIATGNVVSGPDIVSRGFVIPEQEEELLEEAKGVVLTKLEEMQVDQETDEMSNIKADLRRALGKFILERTRRRPMIVPVIVEV